MSDETTPDDRVAALERQLADMQAVHRTALVRTGLRAEAMRAGMVDLDGLKLLDAGDLALDEHGDVVGAPALMAQLKRAKPWLFRLSGASSVPLPVPPALPRRSRRNRAVPRT